MMPDMDSLIGRQVANFRIERLLGRGGMASVYLGWDVKLQRPVAIKLIDARYMDQPEYARRFIYEAQTIAAWRHENILQIYYADDEDGLYYYAMEYIHGLNLEEVLARYVVEEKLMPHSEALRICRAIATALDYAHQRGVIHRDVKPSNVMISEEGRVVLTDFGLALHIAEGTMGQVFGSPRYIAPEQARNSADAVPQSDLYSLGVILYEMLTGKVPFDDPSPMALALQHLTLPPPSPCSINPALSPSVEAVLLKALHKSPAERYQNGHELSEALEEALTGIDKASRLVEAQPSLHIDDSLLLSLSPTKETSLVPTPSLKSTPEKLPPPDQVRLPVDTKTSRFTSHRLLMGGVGGCIGLILIGIVVLGVIFFQNQNRQVVLPDLPRITPTETTILVEVYLPTNTPMTSPTLTLVPDQQLLPTPTSLPTPLPTSTLEPSPTSAPPTPTPEGDLFVMYYDDTAFYMKNLSGKDRSVYPLAIERLDAEGNPIDRFEGWRWGNIYSKFRAGYCMVMWLAELEQHLLPPECSDKILVLHQPLSSYDYIFWVVREGSNRFRVLWDDVEVGRCKIKAGFCEVYLP